MNLFQGVDNGIGVVGDHADIPPFRPSFFPHRVRKEFSTNLHVKAFLLHGFLYGFDVFFRDAAFRNTRNLRSDIFV